MKPSSRVPGIGRPPAYPAVLRTIEKLGRDISHARRVRRMPAEEFATRIGVSRATLYRLEKGDPGISLNTLCMAMHLLGRLGAVADLADQASDDIGLMLSRQAAPRRVRRVRGASSEVGEGEGAATTDDGFVAW
ncbi:putative DNA-binding protein [Methylorubrum extorquens DSM 13060]|uniref:Putative DNA-binding protein n=2 Tax=Methylorubrum extorquens TaxID=408 RepID=H1KGG2_METEX|nr:helix-turn-helix transcriptional regulator [Methylorubrum extorquens]EHP93420.1 putative DNA-binding protein [Methylorubrum extorquens DSM 13060]